MRAVIGSVEPGSLGGQQPLELGVDSSVTRWVS